MCRATSRTCPTGSRGARTWTYIAHRPGWLADGAHWAERTRAVEDKLSDALHQRLAQRFVDRRTAVLLRDVGARGRDLSVVVDEDGTVAVEGEEIGHLHGFAFTPDPAARAGERRMLLAAAEKHLSRELADRARALVTDLDERFDMAFDGGMPPRLLWRGQRVGKLRPGRDTLCPKVELDRSLDSVTADLRAAVLARLDAWLAAAREAHLRVLTRVSALMPKVSGPARGLIVQLVETMGVVPRERVASLIAGLAEDDHKLLARAGVTIGHVHVFAREALKPAATRWRLALWGVAEDVAAMPAPPGASRVAIPAEPGAPRGFYEVAGFWPVGTVAVRVDIVDRLATQLHALRAVHELVAGGHAVGVAPRLGAEQFPAADARARVPARSWSRARPRSNTGGGRRPRARRSRSPPPPHRSRRWRPCEEAEWSTRLVSGSTNGCGSPGSPPPARTRRRSAKAAGCAATARSSTARRRSSGPAPCFLGHPTSVSGARTMSVSCR